MKQTFCQVNKAITAVVTALLLALTLVRPVWAAPVLDLERTYTLRLDCRYEGRALPGAAVRLFRVADVDIRGRYTAVAAFAASGVALTGLDSAAQWREAAQALSDWAKARVLVPEASQTADSDGTATFSGLKAGLYLVELEPLRRADGVYTFTPLLAAVPTLNDDGDGWAEDTAVQPKAAFERDERPSGPDSGPDTPAPVEPGDRLPQTGQLKWPVPVLAVSGMVLFAIGLWLTRRKDHE